MNKSQFIDAVADDCGIAKRDVEKVVKSFLDTIETTLAEDSSESIQFIGFGSFSVAERKARKGFNPQTKQEIEIPASKSVKFKPGAALKEAVNK
ncbi:MAG: HU family DNA-binding protein [Fibrobacterota bacterium]